MTEVVTSNPISDVITAICTSPHTPRRRGELTPAVLHAFADSAWESLDVSGCTALCAADLLAAAPRMPHLRVLDVTGEALMNLK